LGEKENSIRLSWLSGRQAYFGNLLSALGNKKQTTQKPLKGRSTTG